MVYLIIKKAMKRTVKDFSEYIVYSNGDVYSTKRKRLLIQQTDKDGYKYVRLHKDGKQYRKCVHRLVAECFITTDTILKEVNHKNGLKSDNDYKNLEWCTRLENIKHSWDNGLSKYNKHVIDAMNKARLEKVCLTTKQASKETGLARV